MLLREKLINKLLKYILTSSFLFCQELDQTVTDVTGKYGSHTDMLHLFYIHAILYFFSQEAENLKNREHIVQ